jgi:hypothetical protein
MEIFVPWSSESTLGTCLWIGPRLGEVLFKGRQHHLPTWHAGRDEGERLASNFPLQDNGRDRRNQPPVCRKELFPGSGYYTSEFSRIDTACASEDAEAMAASCAHSSDESTLFVVDEQGNSGKSILAQFIAGSLPPKSVSGGKQADIVHVFAKIASTCKYLIFDYARTRQPDFYVWELFEEIKDGGITSLKYDSQCFWGSPNYKILVLGNHDLSGYRHRFTEDRWDVIHLHNASQESLSFNPITYSSPEFRAAYNIDAPQDLPEVTPVDIELEYYAIQGLDKKI